MAMPESAGIALQDRAGPHKLPGCPPDFAKRPARSKPADVVKMLNIPKTLGPGRPLPTQFCHEHRF